MTVSPLPLFKVLRGLLAAQARDAARRVRLDRPAPDLAHWAAPMAGAVRPSLLSSWKAGAARLHAQLPPEHKDGWRSYVLTEEQVFGSPRREVMEPGYATIKAAPAELQLRLLPVAKAAPSARRAGGTPHAANPRVLDAVDEAALKLCRETLETARHDLEYTLESLRRRLKRGLKAGDAAEVIARRLRKLFTDPARAMRIAVTETARAYHGGQLMAAKDAGVVRRKRWLLSANACPACRAVGRRLRKLDEPFAIDPAGGAYAVTDHPPLHPNCQCTLAFVV